MPSVHPYINFDGHCEAAFEFYKSVFGGEFPYVGRFGEMPEGTPIPDSAKDRIMHISLPIGKDSILMGSDVVEGFGPPMVAGNNFAVSVNTESEADAKRIFDGLSEGGVITMPIDKTFWNAYFGMFIDKFGIQWMVNYDYPQE